MQNEIKDKLNKLISDAMNEAVDINDGYDFNVQDVEDFHEEIEMSKEGFRKKVDNDIVPLLQAIWNKAVDGCIRKARYYDARPVCVIDFLENVKREFSEHVKIK